MSASVENPEDNHPIYHPPIESGDKKLFRISPLAVIDHVQGEADRELEKIYRENSVELRVRSGVKYSEDDPSQKSWRFEYGIEFSIDGPKDGLAKQFVDYEPVYSSQESAQSTISTQIFNKLEERSLKDYAEKGFSEAAEILDGDQP